MLEEKVQMARARAPLHLTVLLMHLTVLLTNAGRQRLHSGK